MLGEGLSLEAIGLRVGLHASTVGYWVKKHGLAAVHAAKHAARGGLDRKRVEALVAAGCSISEIATDLGVSKATVRHWLNKYGLRTLRGGRRRDGRLAHAECLLEPSMHCGVHGATKFVLEGRGVYRCKRCRAERVARRRRLVKETLVAEAGGACRLCGYDRDVRALEFHHLDPARKDFGLAAGGAYRSLERLRAEVSKCILLCSNCHAEVESGSASLPS